MTRVLTLKVRLFLLFFWTHRLFKLEPTCHQNKSQIQDLQWGTSCTCIAAEAHQAGIYGESSSEMLIQARFLQSAVLQNCCRFSPEHCLSFTTLGGFFAPHSYLSHTFLDSKSSWKELRGTLLSTVSPLRTEAPCKTLNLTNRGQRGDTSQMGNVQTWVSHGYF